MTDAKGDSAFNWQTLFNQHLNVLKEHLHVWTAVCEGQSEGNPNHGAAHSCLDRTQEMIKNFEKLHTSINPPNGDNDEEQSLTVSSKSKTKSKKHKKGEVTNDSGSTNVVAVNAGEAGEAVKPAKRQRTAESTIKASTADQPMQDVSNLFVIDANPTPVEHLLATKTGKKSESKGKRKHADTAGEPPTSSTEQVKPEKPSKKPKADKQPIDASPEASDTNEDGFVSKVIEKHHKKEHRRKLREERKRKRESEASMTEMEIHAAAIAKPSKKKQKMLRAEARGKTKDAVPEVAAAGGDDGEKVSKKGKKRKSKEVLGEKPIVEEENDKDKTDGGRKRRKR